MYISIKSLYNIFLRIFKGPRVFLLVIALFIILIFQLAIYFNQELILVLQNYGTNFSSRKRLIFPKSFQPENLSTFMEIYPDTINSTTEWSQIALAKHEYKSSFLRDIKYTDHNLNLFHSSENIADLKECNKIQERTTVGISDIKDLKVNLSSILKQFVLDARNNTFYQEMLPYFGDKFIELIENNAIDKHFFRLAGSSVWLDDYGVHFMISRVIYSLKGTRNQPVISMIYAQIFDENWNELKDTTLVVPSNIMGDSNTILDASTGFKMLKFPFFMPIPFYHDYDNLDGKYYGSEDPRIVLTKNKLGFEEPLVIFNAYNRRISKYDDDNDEAVTKEKFVRSIYVCWPWKYQYGKFNTDGESSPETDKKIYNKIVRMEAPELHKVKAQKNWTPLFSDFERERYGYDKNIEFVYRWNNLEVLKCDLDEKEGECSFVYRMDNELPYDAQVGALRGGTDMVNINRLIKSQTNINVHDIIPDGREIFLGFARAHLKDCGCGASFYRPNMVILVKDRVALHEEGENKDEKPEKYLYKVSHLSSYISFNVRLFGWDEEYPDQVCKGNNVLLPNGISNITIASLSKDPISGRWVSEDYSTLTLSMNDFTVYSFHIEGLLDRIFNINDKSLFLPNLEADLMIPSSKNKELIGYNNDNIRCALQSSEEFCKIYGVINQEIYDIDDLDGLDITLLGQY